MESGTMAEMDYWERFAYRCWPGLADTWAGRNTRGLVWCVGMAWLANLLLIGTVLGGKAAPPATQKNADDDQ